MTKRVIVKQRIGVQLEDDLNDIGNYKKRFYPEQIVRVTKKNWLTGKITVHHEVRRYIWAGEFGSRGQENFETAEQALNFINHRTAWGASKDLPSIALVGK